MNILTKFLMKVGNKLIPLYYLGDSGNKEIIYSPVGTTKILLRTGTLDKFVAWEVWKHKAYGDIDINRGDTVVDIGGHIGTFTLFVASKSKTANIFVFEPLPENFKMIKRNLLLNGIKNVKLFQLAVGSRVGRQILHIDSENNGANSFYESDSDKIIQVNTTTLKEIFLVNKIKEINLLKIDAEGAEYDIILNCNNQDLKRIRKIVLEYHDYLSPIFDIKKIINKLTSSGFAVKNNTPYIQRMFMKSGVLQAERL